MADWTKIEEPESEPNVRTVTQLHNDLLPTLTEPPEGRTRIEKLKTLLAAQNWKHLSESQQQLVEEVILKYNTLFILNPNELVKIVGRPAELVVKDLSPVRSPLYRYPEPAKELIVDIIEDMLDKGVIKTSTIAWLSPIVLVNKPDGSKRMCLDYCKVNEHLETDIYPLPRLEELVNAAAGNKYYVTLDLKDAYHQVELAESSRDVTTFNEDVPLYRFTRLPFGIASSPSLFSRHIAQVLAPLKKQGFVHNYLDDVILFAPNFETLVTRLDKLFLVLTEAGVKLNLTKCNFGQKTVKYLRHIISEQDCPAEKTLFNHR